MGIYTGIKVERNESWEMKKRYFFVEFEGMIFKKWPRNNNFVCDPAEGCIKAQYHDHVFSIFHMEMTVMKNDTLKYVKINTNQKSELFFSSFST